MQRQRLTPAFIESGGGRIFVLLRQPAGPARGCVLVAPPFAEEMNKSRRAIAELGGELARRGVSTLTVDLFGTGDSEGEFESATWSQWKDDLRNAVSWAVALGHRLTGLLGIRLGCALAAEAAREFRWSVERTAFWQPVIDGSRMLEQFLRLRVAAAMMEHDSKETTAGLRSMLAAGRCVEVAGYPLSGALAQQLANVRLQEQLAPHLGEVRWFEVVRSADAAPPVPAVKVFDAACSAGTRASMHAVAGEPFWSSVEIVVNPMLLQQTAAFISCDIAADTHAPVKVQAP